MAKMALGPMFTLIELIKGTLIKGKPAEREPLSPVGEPYAGCIVSVYSLTVTVAGPLRPLASLYTSANPTIPQTTQESIRVRLRTQNGAQARCYVEGPFRLAASPTRAASFRSIA